MFQIEYNVAGGTLRSNTYIFKKCLIQGFPGVGREAAPRAPQLDYTHN